jgi:8-oxo-dGTP pyrophosphatase MutT (NUDIX family)
MEIINYLKQRLNLPLPGETAQLQMAHAFRRKLWPAPEDAIDAAVLILFYLKDFRWHNVLIERSSSNPSDRHAGQISFPGGKKESSDTDLIQCAMREAYEEVGLQPEETIVIGKLTPLYIPVSNFKVHPIVAYTEVQPRFIAQQAEVASIIEMPFDHFLNKEHVKNTDLVIGSGIKMDDVPYFDVQGKILWGATAMMLSELLTIVREAEVFSSKIY